MVTDRSQNQIAEPRVRGFESIFAIPLSPGTRPPGEDCSGWSPHGARAARRRDQTTYLYFTNVGGMVYGGGHPINSGRGLLPELVLLGEGLLVLVELGAGLDLRLDLLGHLFYFFFGQSFLLFDLRDLRG